MISQIKLKNSKNNFHFRKIMDNSKQMCKVIANEYLDFFRCRYIIKQGINRCNIRNILKIDYLIKK